VKPVNLAELKVKLKKKWESGIFLAALIREDEELFPLRVPVRGPSASEMVNHFDELRGWAAGFRAEAGRRNLQLEWKQVNHRQLGRNEIPSALMFPDIKNLARFLGEQRALERFRRLSDRLLSAFPELTGWTAGRPFELIRSEEYLDRLMLVAGWVRSNPAPGIFLRELSLPGVDTKFIERHRGILSQWLDILLPAEEIDASFTGGRGFEGRYGFRSRPELVRFRFLDPDLSVGGFTDLSVPVSGFLSFEPERIDRIFVTENDINGLAFPPIKNALIIFGRGYNFSALAGAVLLRKKPLFYWGDIDTHGFAILNQFRTHFPHARSFLMDRETFFSHSVHWGKEPSPTISDLPNLTPEESSLYDELRSNRSGENLRLEQEFIAYNLVRERLEKLPDFSGQQGSP
jgi:hypothetical protein